MVEFTTDRRVLVVFSVFVVSCIVFFSTPPRRNAWLGFVVGLIAFYFIEYFVHRFVLHGYFKRIMPKAYEGHMLHHNHPVDTEYLLTPNSYNVPYYMLFWAVLLLGTRNAHVTAAFIAGVSIFQLYYEWAHFVAHRPIIPRTPWGKWMKKYHLLHHFKDGDYWFGVTNPTLDMVAGTHIDPKLVSAESKYHLDEVAATRHDG